MSLSASHAHLAAVLGTPADATDAEVAERALLVIEGYKNFADREAELLGRIETLKADLAACDAMLNEGAPDPAGDQVVLAEEAMSRAEKRADLAELHADELTGKLRDVTERVALECRGKQPIWQNPSSGRGKEQVYPVSLPVPVVQALLADR